MSEKVILTEEGYQQLEKRLEELKFVKRPEITERIKKDKIKRRAKAKEDWSEVEKYYNLVEQNDPTNIEAIFYSAFESAIKFS